MCQHRGNQSAHHSHDQEHHHHHDGSDHGHHQDRSQPEGTELNIRQKLVVRLEHALRHNREHKDFYDKLAEEADALEGNRVAQEIREVARWALLQNEHIEKALSIIHAR